MGVALVVAVVAVLLGFREGFRPYVDADFFVLVSCAIYWNNWSAGGRHR